LIPGEKSIEYSALDLGLERFIRLDQEVDIIGKQGFIDVSKRGCRK